MLSFLISISCPLEYQPPSSARSLVPAINPLVNCAMDHTVNESASEFPPDSSHETQSDTSASTRTTDIEHGSGPNVGPEPRMPQADILNQVLESYVPSIGSSLTPTFFTYNNQIESLTSSFTTNNSASSETLLQDTRLENAYYGFPFCVDLDFPILTGEPVEVDFDMVDIILPNIGEFPLIMGSMFDEVSIAHIAAVEPTAFSINNTVNSPSTTGQSIINHINKSQPVLGPTTAGSYVTSSRDPQPMDRIAKAIDMSSKHSYRVKHLAPKQQPTHQSYPPGSSSTGKKQRLASISHMF